MSNYPPGVSGNEFAINGPDYEQEETHSCGRFSKIQLLPVDLRERIEELINFVVDIGNIGLVRQYIDHIKEFLQEPLTVEIDCPFDGEVVVQGYRGTKWWTCPVCNYEHEIEVEEYE